MRDNVYLRLGLPLLVVCVVASSGLAVTWGLTASKIEAQAKEAEVGSLSAVLPDSAGFRKVTDEKTLAVARKAAGDVGIDAIYAGIDQAGDPNGTGVMVSSRGYGGPIRIAVGLDRNGKVIGAKIVSMNETPGLGTKVVEDRSFLRGFAGSASVEEAHDVDTITGATKSSRGVRNGVEAALAAYRAFGGADGEDAK